MRNIGRKIAVMAEMKEIKFRKTKNRQQIKILETSNDLHRFIKKKRQLEQIISPPVKFGIAA